MALPKGNKNVRKKPQTVRATNDAEGSQPTTSPETDSKPKRRRGGIRKDAEEPPTRRRPLHRKDALAFIGDYQKLNLENPSDWPRQYNLLRQNLLKGTSKYCRENPETNNYKKLVAAKLNKLTRFNAADKLKISKEFPRLLRKHEDNENTPHINFAFKKHMKGALNEGTPGAAVILSEGFLQLYTTLCLSRQLLRTEELAISDYESWFADEMTDKAFTSMALVLRKAAIRNLTTGDEYPLYEIFNIVLGKLTEYIIVENENYKSDWIRHIPPSVRLQFVMLVLEYKLQQDYVGALVTGMCLHPNMFRPACLGVDKDGYEYYFLMSNKKLRPKNTADSDEISADGEIRILRRKGKKGFYQCCGKNLYDILVIFNELLATAPKENPGNRDCDEMFKELSKKTETYTCLLNSLERPMIIAPLQNAQLLVGFKKKFPLDKFYLKSKQIIRTTGKRGETKITGNPPIEITMLPKTKQQVRSLFNNYLELLKNFKQNKLPFALLFEGKENPEDGYKAENAFKCDFKNKLDRTKCDHCTCPPMSRDSEEELLCPYHSHYSLVGNLARLFIEIFPVTEIDAEHGLNPGAGLLMLEQICNGTFNVTLLTEQQQPDFQRIETPRFKTLEEKENENIDAAAKAVQAAIVYAKTKRDARESKAKLKPNARYDQIPTLMATDEGFAEVPTVKNMNWGKLPQEVKQRMDIAPLAKPKISYDYVDENLEREEDDDDLPGPSHRVHTSISPLVKYRSVQKNDWKNVIQHTSSSPVDSSVRKESDQQLVTSSHNLSSESTRTMPKTNRIKNVAIRKQQLVEATSEKSKNRTFEATTENDSHHGFSEDNHSNESVGTLTGNKLCYSPYRETEMKSYQQDYPTRATPSCVGLKQTHESERAFEKTKNLNSFNNGIASSFKTCPQYWTTPVTRSGGQIRVENPAISNKRRRKAANQLEHKHEQATKVAGQEQSVSGGDQTANRMTVDNSVATSHHLLQRETEKEKIKLQRELDEQKRLKEEEAERAKIELQKRLEAEEEARRKMELQWELDEQKRLEEQEETRREMELQRELAEQKRLEEEDDARRELQLQMELEEQKRLKAEEAEKVEMELQRKLEEQRRLEAEEAERVEMELQWEQEQQKRLEEEDKAKREMELQWELDELERLEEEDDAKREMERQWERDEQKRLKAKEAEKVEMELQRKLEEKKRLEAEEAERVEMELQWEQEQQKRLEEEDKARREMELQWELDELERLEEEDDAKREMERQWERDEQKRLKAKEAERAEKELQRKLEEQKRLEVEEAERVELKLGNMESDRRIEMKSQLFKFPSVSNVNDCDQRTVFELTHPNVTEQRSAGNTPSPNSQICSPPTKVSLPSKLNDVKYAASNQESMPCGSQHKLSSVVNKTNNENPNPISNDSSLQEGIARFAQVLQTVASNHDGQKTAASSTSISGLHTPDETVSFYEEQLFNLIPTLSSFHSATEELQSEKNEKELSTISALTTGTHTLSEFAPLYQQTNNYPALSSVQLTNPLPSMMSMQQSQQNIPWQESSQHHMSPDLPQAEVLSKPKQKRQRKPQEAKPKVPTKRRRQNKKKTMESPIDEGNLNGFAFPTCGANWQMNMGTSNPVNVYQPPEATPMFANQFNTQNAQVAPTYQVGPIMPQYKHAQQQSYHFGQQPNPQLTQEQFDQQQQQYTKSSYSGNHERSVQHPQQYHHQSQHMLHQIHPQQNAHQSNEIVNLQQQPATSFQPHIQYQHHGQQIATSSQAHQLPLFNNLSMEMRHQQKEHFPNMNDVQKTVPQQPGQMQPHFGQSQNQGSQPVEQQMQMMHRSTDFAGFPGQGPSNYPRHQQEYYNHTFSGQNMGQQTPFVNNYNNIYQMVPDSNLNQIAQQTNQQPDYQPNNPDFQYQLMNNGWNPNKPF